jgi:hypothetical protein
MSNTAREWLRDNGYRVKPKGRIPADLLAIFQAKDKKNAAASVRANNSVLSDINSDEPENNTSPQRKSKAKRTSCGFCTVVAEHRHKHCPGTIQQGSKIGGVWTCLCYERGHVDG